MDKTIECRRKQEPDRGDWGKFSHNMQSVWPEI